MCRRVQPNGVDLGLFRHNGNADDTVTPIHADFSTGTYNNGVNESGFIRANRRYLCNPRSHYSTSVLKSKGQFPN